MSELRWHPFLQTWVISATHRQGRPLLPPPQYCPFCPSRPGANPTEVPADDYEIVVFQNKFPSLQPDPPAPVVEGTELYPVAPARGECEVVLYSADHYATLTEQPVAHLRNLIEVWADRYHELGDRPEVQYVFIFENRGAEVGVTLHHPHGQIYAYPFIPPIPAQELAAGREHLQRTGRCLGCDVVAEERRDGRRVLHEDEHFIAFVPFFARFPYEVHLYPKAHRAAITELSEAERWSLARALKATLIRYDGLWGFPLPYMMVQHQRPTDGGAHEYCHFHVEFYPLHRTRDKLKYLAGSETGAGAFIVDITAEAMAERLRAVPTGQDGPAISPGGGERTRRGEHAMSREPGHLRTLLDEFHNRYPYDPALHPDDEAVVVRAPGRVNLIGEHTDYNDGFVMPLAIDREILLAGRRRRDGAVRVCSLNLHEEAAFRLEDVAAAAGTSSIAGWSRYVAGVVWALRTAGLAVGGFDAALVGNIPPGAGLSSSAALEVGVAVLLEALFGFELDRVLLARLCQRAENEYVGVQCGIMDQFAVALGRQGHALLLDCRRLDYRYVPLSTQQVRLVVADTGVRRALASSEYNTRRRECQEGVSLLQRHLPDVKALRDVAPHVFEQLAQELPDIIARRASHVIYENVRVQAAADLLAQDNFSACGHLMYASHASLRDQYEVSCPELDTMVEIARSVPGVYGARMTGAGFGGCVVSLVRADAVEALLAAIQAEYPARTGRTPAVYVVAPSDGAARVL